MFFCGEFKIKVNEEDCLDRIKDLDNERCAKCIDNGAPIFGSPPDDVGFDNTETAVNVCATDDCDMTVRAKGLCVSCYAKASYQNKKNGVKPAKKKKKINVLVACLGDGCMNEVENRMSYCSDCSAKAAELIKKRRAEIVSPPIETEETISPSGDTLRREDMPDYLWFGLKAWKELKPLKCKRLAVILLQELAEGKESVADYGPDDC